MSKTQDTNTRSPMPISHHTRTDDFNFHERLPPLLRRLIAESHVAVSSIWVYSLYQQMGEMNAFLKFLGGERNEIALFAQHYNKDTGTPYPFVAAGGTIMRYFSAKKRRPLNYEMRVPNVRRRRG